MADIEKVLQMIQDNDVKFVDLRFTDMKGKEQHVSIPPALWMKTGSKKASLLTVRRWQAGKALKLAI